MLTVQVKRLSQCSWCKYRARLFPYINHPHQSTTCSMIYSTCFPQSSGASTKKINQETQESIGFSTLGFAHRCITCAHHLESEIMHLCQYFFWVFRPTCRNASKAARFLSSVVPLPSSRPVGNTCQIAWAHQTFKTSRCRQWSTSIVKLRVGQMLAMPPNSGLRWRVIVSSLHLQNVTVAGEANVSRAPTSGKATQGSIRSPATRPSRHRSSQAPATRSGRACRTEAELRLRPWSFG